MARTVLGNSVTGKVVALLATLAVAHAATAAYQWNLPPGFRGPQVPASNPMSVAKVELGRRLFFDTRLSVTRRYSCASCHQPELAFTDGRPFAQGATGARLTRSAMSLANVAYSTALGWRAPGFKSLEAQMQQPLFNERPVEMGVRGHEREVLQSLRSDQELVQQFAQAFPQARAPVSLQHVIQAIACFERTLISGHSAFDRYVFADEPQALTDSAKRGMALFYSKRLNCASCHFGIAFAGPAAIAGQPVPRPLYANTGTGGRFKVPTLRNVAFSAPYMHDGRFRDLAAVIEHYERPSQGAVGSVEQDLRLASFQLSVIEKQDLIDFLNSLSDLQFVASAAVH